MVVVSALCALLVSLTIMAHDNTNKQFFALEQKLVLDQVGISFVKSASFELNDELKQTYSAHTEQDENGRLLVLKLNNEQQSVVFSVKLDSSNNIIEWKYN